LKAEVNLYPSACFNPSALCELSFENEAVGVFSFPSPILWYNHKPHMHSTHTRSRRTKTQKITQEIHSRGTGRDSHRLTLSPRKEGIIGYVRDRGELWVNALVRNDSLQSLAVI